MVDTSLLEVSFLGLLFIVELVTTTLLKLMLVSKQVLDTDTLWTLFEFFFSLLFISEVKESNNDPISPSPRGGFYINEKIYTPSKKRYSCSI